MSTAAVLSIINRSLLGIGARAQVQSIAEGSTESNAAAVLFTPTFEALARSAHWNCLRGQETLSLLAAAKGTPENPDGVTLPLPPTPWLYQYSLPPNCLNVRYLIPSSVNGNNGAQLTTVGNSSGPNLRGGGKIDFAVAYATDPTNNPIQVILTNQTQAVCVFTVNQPNPVVWDSLFQAAMVASLGAFFVPALSLNIALMQIQIKVAEAAISIARVRDGDEGVTCQDHIPDWISARNSGVLYGQGYNSSYGYANMMWPGVG